MADVIWQGDVDTDPTDGLNWDTGVVPALGEDVIFDSTASGNCAGGDLSGVVVASITITDDCTIDIGTSAADALDWDCNGIVEDAGSGTHYLNIENTTEWNVYGSGTYYIDGIDNDALNINASGSTSYVGPIVATPVEFDTVITVDAGTVHFQAVTDQAAAVTDLTIKGGTTDSDSGFDTFQQYAGIHTQEAGGLNNPTIASSGKCIYNSNAKIDGILDLMGEIDYGDNYRAVAIDDCHLHSGAVLRDPHGRVTFAAAFEMHDCDATEITLDLGKHRKYTVADI